MSNHTIAVVDSQSGHLLANTDKPFILALKQGESVFEGILKCAKAANIQSASVSGLGGFSDCQVAYYNLETKEYQTQLFQEMHELVSLYGNITFVDGKHFLHIHAALSNHHYQMFGGHIMEAIVNPSAEITIIPLNGKIERAYDAGTGLKLMCPMIR
jgi:uncharacterized protein